MYTRYMKKPSKNIILILIIILVVLARFINISWGLPYPFHPDERNMADAVIRLECDVSAFGEKGIFQDAQSCFNPEFYAYGQAPLYIGYGMVKAWHMLIQLHSSRVTFEEAVIALRIQSIVASLLTLVVLIEIVQFFRPIRQKTLLAGLIFFTFQPYVIQYAHFGTTESLLMLLYGTVVLLTCRLYTSLTLKNIILLGGVLGVSVGIKISSLSFAILPGIVFLYIMFKDRSHTIQKVRRSARLILLGLLSAFIGFAFTSPQYVLNTLELIGSMYYEIAVGDGSLRVFYTRQFEDTIPYVYQFVKVFPYSNGILGVMLFLGSFLFFPWTNPYFNILRIAYIAYFVPAGMVYTKWARFVAPVMPIMTLMGFVWLLHVAKMHAQKHYTRWLTLILIVIAAVSLLPGLAYLSVYTQRDVRFEASDWMNTYIPEGSVVLLETGNVINLPVFDAYSQNTDSYGKYHVSLINLYDADRSPESAEEVIQALESADYVVIASRRIFANHTCLWPDKSIIHQLWDQKNPLSSGKYLGWCQNKRATYPVVQSFFERVFDPDKYKLVQTFSSQPSLQLWDTVLLQIHDEFAEEAWTVFDHPTIRVYSKLE